MHTNQLQEQDALCRAQEDRSPVSRSVVSFLQGSETSPVVMPTHPRLERHQAFHSGSVDLASNAGSEGQRGMAETSAHALGINLKLLARGRGVWLTGDVEANRGVSGREEPVLDNRNPRSHRVPHSQMGWLDLFTNSQRGPAPGFLSCHSSSSATRASDDLRRKKEFRGRTPAPWSGILNGSLFVCLFVLIRYIICRCFSQLVARLSISECCALKHESFSF